MNPKKSLYSIANKIRTKLLLFTDKEIRSQKNKYNLYLPKAEIKEDKYHYISTEETYSQKSTEIIYSNFGFQTEEIKNKNTKETFSTCNDTPINTKVIHSNNLFHLKDKIYTINKTLKPSSTFLIIEKPKINKNYLKILCDSLKFSKRNYKCSFRYKSNNLKNVKIDSNKFNTSMNKENFSRSLKKSKLDYLNGKSRQTECPMEIKSKSQV